MGAAGSLVSRTSRFTLAEISGCGGLPALAFVASEFPLHIQRSQLGGLHGGGIPAKLLSLWGLMFVYFYIPLLFMSDVYQHILCVFSTEKVGKAAPSVFSSVRSGGETALSKPSARPVRK